MSLAFAASVAASTVQAAGRDAETAIQACQDLGNFTAGVVRVTPSDTPLSSGVQVRTLAIVVRLHNMGNRPLVVAYQEGSLRVLDNNGNTFAVQWHQPGTCPALVGPRESRPIRNCN